jgi:hypothetical protein
MATVKETNGKTLLRVADATADAAEKASITARAGIDRR